MQRSRKGQLYTDIILETFKLNGILINTGDQLGKTFGVTSARWKIMGSLENAGTPMTVSQIAHLMGQARQSVQRLSDVLVTEGLLVYQKNPNHKKAKLLLLSEKGKKVMKNLDIQYSEWVNQISKMITVDDLKTTLQVLTYISNQLEN